MYIYLYLYSVKYNNTATVVCIHGSRAAVLSISRTKFNVRISNCDLDNNSNVTTRSKGETNREENIARISRSKGTDARDRSALYV